MLQVHKVIHGHASNSSAAREMIYNGAGMMQIHKMYRHASQHIDVVLLIHLLPMAVVHPGMNIHTSDCATVLLILLIKGLMAKTLVVDEVFVKYNEAWLASKSMGM